MAQVIWSDVATVELKAVYDYIFQYSVQSAENIIEGILKNVDYIKLYPEIGTPVIKYTNINLRQRYFKSYKIFYIDQGNKIFIITILHKSRLFSLSEKDISSIIK